MRNFGILLISVFFTTTLFSQDLSKVFQTDSATWFGLDYSEAYFVGTDGFTNPDDMKARTFDSWNGLIIEEPNKYNIGEFFYKRHIIFSLDIVSSRNQSIEIHDRVSNDNSKTTHLDKQKVQEIIKEYDFKDEQHGLGIVFIVESYNKITVQGNYFVTLFDIETKEVLITERLQGKARGFGLRNYWAHSYLKVMKKVHNDQYSIWAKKSQ